jgi:hypothetical protein
MIIAPATPTAPIAAIFIPITAPIARTTSIIAPAGTTAITITILRNSRAGGETRNGTYCGGAIPSVPSIGRQASRAERKNADASAQQTCSNIHDMFSLNKCAALLLLFSARQR